MNIQLLHSPGCPNQVPARSRLDEAVERTGVSVEIVEREVGTQAEAEQLGMMGSPTILVDGREVRPAEGTASLSCRLDGGPSVEELVAALTR